MISNQQTPQEWLWFLDQLPVLRSVLEIGSYDGMSLLAWGSSGILAQGAIIRSIDLGNHGTGPRLQEVCRSLTSAGFDAKCFIADSRHRMSETWARQWAPYDLVFVDGDHSFEGVMADWERYGPMGKIVALHDIGGHEAGCVKAWREVKANGHRTTELTADPKYQIVSLGQQGIGMVFNDDAQVVAA